MQNAERANSLPIILSPNLLMSKMQQGLHIKCRTLQPPLSTRTDHKPSQILTCKEPAFLDNWTRPVPATIAESRTIVCKTPDQNSVSDLANSCKSPSYNVPCLIQASSAQFMPTRRLLYEPDSANHCTINACHSPRQPTLGQQSTFQRIHSWALTVSTKYSTSTGVEWADLKL